MSCRDNLLAVLEALGNERAGKRADELLTRFGLVQVAAQKARTLSGGERRRLEFARCLCSEPSILLSDEPFSGVDPIAVQEIASAIEDLAARGVGVLLTDHSVREALKICGRVYLIAEGKLIAEGTPEEILNSEAARRVYLGASFDV